MNDLVGIIRVGSELQDALTKLTELKSRMAKVGVVGGKEYNPGWHLVLDLENMHLVSTAIAKSAITREESRGGHTRDDYQAMDPNWRNKNVVCSLANGDIQVAIKDLPMLPPDLLALFDKAELKKYFTDQEYAQLPKEVA